MGQSKQKKNPNKREKKVTDGPSKDIDVEQSQQMLMQMRSRMNTLSEQVGKLEARYHASQKEEMETTITKRDLERDDAPDAICYLRTGRMFTQHPRVDILAKLTQQHEAAKENSAKLKVTLAQMQIKTRQEQATFQQMLVEVSKVKAEQQKQATAPPPVAAAGYPVAA